MENLDDGVVERTNSWHNRFRAILIRWERKSENYLASLYLASSIIALTFLIGSFETGSKRKNFYRSKIGLCGRPYKRTIIRILNRKNDSVVQRNTGYLGLDKPEHPDFQKSYNHT
ncbi:transposase DDE domain protein [Leptospira mayottensis 200901122]|uniref:Transposase DDE domain protein n=1 Tax=Leptospira mayottensis 200901122 TaxID=1193010 RepID=A0AA87MPH9_9LEPT|nr:transposase DDE domain protein [Leptospira mayottensis 200901122]